MLAVLAEAQQQAFEKGRSTGYALADTYLRLQRKKEAVRYLQAAFAAHDTVLFTLSRSAFETELSGDPDFEQLKRQVQSYTSLMPRVNGTGRGLAVGSN